MNHINAYNDWNSAAMIDNGRGQEEHIYSSNSTTTQWEILFHGQTSWEPKSSLYDSYEKLDLLH